MKKKNYQLKSIEDIALQFIKHNEKISDTFADSIATVVDTKFYIKKIMANNKNYIFSQNSEILIPCDTPRISNQNTEKDKLIIFQKLPQKNLIDDEVSMLNITNDNSMIDRSSHIQTSISTNSNIKKLKYTKKLFFPLKYDNVYENLTELYTPMLQNLENINLFKNLVIDTQSRVDYFYSHSSINETKIQTAPPLSEFLEQEKICEFIEFSLILFIMHIILEVKLELIDLIEENELISVYQEILSVMKKIYENVMLKLLFNDIYNTTNNNNNNNNNKKTNKPTNLNNSISFESLCKKYVDAYFKLNNKLKPNQIIEKLNENLEIIVENLYSAVNILYKTLIIIIKQTANCELPENEDDFFKGIITSSSTNTRKNNTENNDTMKNDNNISDSNAKKQFQEEFIDQFNFFKIMNKFLSSIINNTNTNITQKYTDIKKYAELYYENFKYLIEKNKVKPPYLPPLDSKKHNFTLVLDLDETLVHYIEEENRAYVQVRPFADYFLSELSKLFELVIFTAAAEDYADLVLNELDKNKLISYKLYRKHTEPNNGIFVKNLMNIGRNLEKCCIIDNNKDNFCLQPENGLHISSFLGDQNDNELFLLCNDLKKIASYKKKDIRPFVKEIDKLMKKRYTESNIMVLEK